MKSFFSHLAVIGTAIENGLKVAISITAVVDPPLAPILTGVAQIIALLEAKGQNLTSDQVTQIVQAVTLVEHIKGTSK